MSVNCYFDGGCSPINPGGHAGYGCIIQDGAKTIFRHSGYVGHGPEMSNNVAEYSGVIEVLRFLLRENISEATIYGDSLMVIRQLNGQIKARRGLYLSYYHQAIKLRRQLPSVQLRHIRREYNVEADYLAGQAIKNAPRAAKRNQELVRLIKAQRADDKDRYTRFDNAVRK